MNAPGGGPGPSTIARPNPIDAYRYGSNPSGATTDEIARAASASNVPPSQLSPFLDADQWAAESPAQRYSRVSYLLTNPHEFAPGGRQHAMFAGAMKSLPDIPGVTRPGVPVHGAVPLPPPTTGTPPGGNGPGGGPSGNGGTAQTPQGGDGTETPAVSGLTSGTPSTAPTGTPPAAATGAAPAPATGENPQGDQTATGTPLGEAPNAPGFDASHSFSTGGRFGSTGLGSFLGNPGGTGRIGQALLSLALGQVSPALTLPSTALSIEQGLQFGQKNMPQTAQFLGLGPVSTQPNYVRDPRTGLYHTLPPVTVTARSGGEQDSPGGGAPSASPTGQGTPTTGLDVGPGAPVGAGPTGPPGIPGGIQADISSFGPIASIDVPTVDVPAALETTVSSLGLGPQGQPADVSLSTEGAPATGGEAEGGVGPSSGTPGAGVSAGDPDAGQGIDAGPAGPAGDTSGDGGGGGGGDGGGGCYLANWTLDSLRPKDAGKAKKFFQEFYDGFMRLQGSSGKRLFSLYQLAAQRLMRAVQQRGPNDVRRVQQEIYDRLVVPTGRSVEAHEIPTAVKNLVSVVTDLSRTYGVPLTPEMQKAAQTFTQGKQPGVFTKRN